MAVTALRVTALLIALATSPGICLAQGVPEHGVRSFRSPRQQPGRRREPACFPAASFSSIDSDRNHRITAQELQATVGEQWEGVPSAADGFALPTATRTAN